MKFICTNSNASPKRCAISSMPAWRNIRKRWRANPRPRRRPMRASSRARSRPISRLIRRRFRCWPSARLRPSCFRVPRSSAASCWQAPGVRRRRIIPCRGRSRWAIFRTRKKIAHAGPSSQCGNFGRSARRFKSARGTSADVRHKRRAGSDPARADDPRLRKNKDQATRIVATSVVSSPLATADLLAFARSLARDHRPIIIDLDPKGRAVASLVATDVAAPIGRSARGLTDLLSGTAAFAEVIHRDAGSRLHFITFGSGATFDPADLDLVLDALGQTYDFIILAAPALCEGGKAKALAPFSDFVALVGAGASAQACSEAYDALLAAGAVGRRRGRKSRQNRTPEPACRMRRECRAHPAFAG